MHSLGRLERAAAGHRVTVVEALPGYGKTRLRQQLERLHATVSVSADDPAAVVRALTASGVERVLVEDVHLLGSDDEAVHAIVARAGRADAPALVLFAAPALPGPLAALATGEHVLQIGEPELAWQAPQVEAHLRRALGADSAGIAARLQALSDGWPALVVAAVQQLSRTPYRDGDALSAALDDCFGSGGPVSTFLLERVLGQLPAAVQDLLRLAAHLETADVSVLAAAVPDAQVAQLVVRHLAGVVEDVAVLRPPVLAAVRASWPIPAEQVREQMQAAAARLRAAERAPAAVVALRLAGDEQGLSQLLADCGQELVRAGHDRVVVDGVRAVPPGNRCTALTLLLGEALQVRGDWEGALRCYDSVARDAASGEDDLIGAGLAWRMGVIHYLRGQPREAERCYRQGRLVDEDTCDEAQLLAGWPPLRG